MPLVRRGNDSFGVLEFGKTLELELIQLPCKVNDGH